MSDLKHVGRSAYRISSNPAEEVFAWEWAKINERTRLNGECGTLDWLLHGDGSKCKRWETTQEEATIAATVIQWLGSPVGAEWLAETLKKARRAEL